MRGGPVLVLAASAPELPRLRGLEGVRTAITGMGAACEVPDLSGCSAVVVTGTCGSLTPSLRSGALLLATGVVVGGETLQPDAGWTATLQASAEAARIGVVRGVLAHAEQVVDGASARAELARDAGAQAVDLESAIVARAARRAGVPWAVLRVVSDGPEEPLAWLLEMAGDAPTPWSVTAGLLRRPWLLPTIAALGMRITGGTRRAARVIAGAVRLRA